MNRTGAMMLSICMAACAAGCREIRIEYEMDRIAPWSRSGNPGVRVDPVTRTGSETRAVRITLPGHRDRRYYGLQWTLDAREWRHCTGIRFSLRSGVSPAVYRIKLQGWSDKWHLNDIYIPGEPVSVQDTQWHDYVYRFDDFHSWFTGLDDPAHRIPFRKLTRADLFIERMGSDQPASWFEFGSFQVFGERPRYRFW